MTIRYEDLIAFAAGELDADRAARLEAELASDPGARRTVDAFRRVAAIAASDNSVAPSADAVLRAKAVFDAAALRAGRPAGWWVALERVVAALCFDSRVQPVAVRYADAGARIQLAFESDRAEIDLQAERLAAEPGAGAIAPAASGAARWRLTGQIAGERLGSCRVVLLDADGAAVDETMTDERGMFIFDVESGRYELGFAVDGGLLVAPALELPALAS
jgi:anti-sigma factor RsiW